MPAESRGNDRAMSLSLSFSFFFLIFHINPRGTLWMDSWWQDFWMSRVTEAPQAVLKKKGWKEWSGIKTLMFRLVCPWTFPGIAPRPSFCAEQSRKLGDPALAAFTVTSWRLIKRISIILTWRHTQNRNKSVAYVLLINPVFTTVAIFFLFGAYFSCIFSFSLVSNLLPDGEKIKKHQLSNAGEGFPVCKLHGWNNMTPLFFALQPPVGRLRCRSPWSFCCRSPAGLRSEPSDTLYKRRPSNSPPRSAVHPVALRL